MALLFTNGFDHQYGRTLFHGFPFYGLNSTATRPNIAATQGRDGGVALEVWVQQFHEEIDEDAGGHVDLDVAGDLYFGLWMKAHNALPDAGLIRLCYIEVADSRVLQVWANYQASTVYGQPAQSVALWDGTDDIAHAGDTAGSMSGTMIAVSSSGSFLSNTNHLMSFALERGSGSGRFQMVSNGVSLLDVDPVDELDVADGAITKVVLSMRARDQSGSNRQTWLDDIWFDDERAYNDPRLVTYQPVAQGFYSDGTPTGAATGWEAVAGAPPDLGEYVTLASGDKDSHEFATVGDAGRAGIGGVTHRMALRTDLPVKVFHREDSADTEVAEHPASSVNTQRLAIMPVNPSTSEPWTLSELSDAEFGIEAP